MPARDPVRIAKPFVFALGILPITWLTWAFLILVEKLPPNEFIGGLTANPVEYIRNYTGEWTLRFLIATLALTPLRQVTGWNGAIRFRRMFGLFAFLYGAVHFITYLGFNIFDMEAPFWFDTEVLWKDVAKRPFITAGFISFVLMIPLAVTSTKGWIKRLGGRRWQRLHWLIYPSAVAGVVHYYWKGKLIAPEPLIYAAVLAVLLGYRVWKKTAGKSAGRSAAG